MTSAERSSPSHTRSSCFRKLATSINAVLVSQREALGDRAFGALRLFKALAQAETNADHADPALVELLQVIQQTPALRGLLGKYCVRANASGLIDMSTLVGWLLFKANLDGTQSVLHALTRLGRARKIPLKHVVAIGALVLKHPVRIDSTAKLVPWEQISSSETKAVVQETLWETQNPYPTAALLRETTAPRSDVLSDSAESPLFSATWDVRDLVRCLCLFGGAPHAVAQWTELPTWVPGSRVRFQYSIVSKVPPPLEWSAEAHKHFAPFYKRFLKLPDAQKEKFRIALDRLRNANSRNPNEDRAIDLGIALETLFLSDERGATGELRFNLATRAARFLGKSSEERKDIFDRVQRLYDLRSRAVHRGVVEAQIKGTQTADFISQGRCPEIC
ncbi:MAG TPA: hypothetical protein VNK91_09225 [Burkholderiaceae bacterium]|nr:hypothetical protein [Burkholderiaceae bacterium]